MPVYEYECERGHRSEDIVPHPDERKDSIECPQCRLDAVRVVSRPMGHIWSEHAARNIECKHASKTVHRGVLDDGRTYETLGGPPPEAGVG